MPPGHIGDMNIADQIAVVAYCLDDVSLFNLRVIDIQQQPYPGAPDFLNQTNRVLDSRHRAPTCQFPLPAGARIRSGTPPWRSPERAVRTASCGILSRHKLIADSWGLHKSVKRVKSDLREILNQAPQVTIYYAAARLKSHLA